jgi:type I restriction-modification system DNA methylase subunit
MGKNNTTQEEPLEKQLWKAADKLRKNIDAAEYKHIVMGLIFLRYISDAFEELYSKLQKGEGDYAGADPEDRDEYNAESVFFVPPKARWSYLQSEAKQPEIGKYVDDAMDLIEKENPSLKGVLPKVCARDTVEKYCILAESMAFSQSNYGILPNIKDCFFFTYMIINHVVEKLQSSAYGSVFDTITTTTFK